LRNKLYEADPHLRKAGIYTVPHNHMQPFSHMSNM